MIFFGVTFIAMFAMHGPGIGHGGHGGCGHGQDSGSAKDPSAQQGKGNDKGGGQSCH
ncbi:MAG: hypothetical protein Q7R39_18820 [Dehalococcoidia bacterium]|nr:hypothetical protein [Dehalococcoidia bacterium]